MTISRLVSQETINQVSTVAVKTTIGAVVGYLSVKVFTNLNPMLGLAFGAFYTVSGLVVDPIFKNKKSNTASQILNTALKALIAGLAAMKTLGIAFSLKTVLTISTAVIIAAPLTGVALFLGAILIGAVAYRLITGSPASNFLNFIS